MQLKQLKLKYNLIQNEIKYESFINEDKIDEKLNCLNKLNKFLTEY